MKIMNVNIYMCIYIFCHIIILLCFVVFFSANLKEKPNL